MRLPVEVSFARKISLNPELERGVPKIFVLVPWKEPETRTLPEKSVVAEKPKSSEVPQANLAHMTLPVEESFARKMSEFPQLVRGVPKTSMIPVLSKYPVTITFQSESVAAV
jgi:hypothetical protein